MTLARKVVGIALALMLILSGIGHFLSPELYFPLIPSWLPKSFANTSTGLLEIALGIGVFIPNVRKKALLGICILMIFFLPIHIFDALKASPIIGSKTVAVVRIILQFVLIYLPWFARKS